MKRLIGAFLIISMALVAGRLAYDGLTRLPWLKLRHVEINCEKKLNKDEILKVGGFNLNESVFGQDLQYAATRLVNLPGIEKVNVERNLPDRIMVSITPDQIVLLAMIDRLQGLTRTLKLIDLENSDQVLPVITGLSRARRLSYAERMKLCYGLQIYDYLKKASSTLAGRLSEIHFADSRTVELFFNPGGLKVVMNLRQLEISMKRLSVMDTKGLLGNAGAFDMTAGRIIIWSGAS
jgi:cell division septal protein FtsQ